jgi:hypothetical protein
MSLVKTYVMLLCHACGVPFTSLRPIQSMYTHNDGVTFFIPELSYFYICLSSFSRLIYLVFIQKNSKVFDVKMHEIKNSSSIMNLVHCYILLAAICLDTYRWQRNGSGGPPFNI